LEAVFDNLAVKRALKPLPVSLWSLKVESVWDLCLKARCVRVIEIREEASLDDLHLAIQSAVKFDNDHPYEFCAGRTERQRKLTFGESPESPFDVPESADVRLNQVFPLPERLKLYCWFDFGDDWKFQITRLRKVQAPERGVKYPRVIERVGPDPEQYPEVE
jgi:hypothetical protein